MRLKNLYIVLFLFIIASAVVVRVNIRPQINVEQESITLLPERLGEWEKQDRIVYEDRIMSILGTPDVTGTVYRNRENEVVTVVMVRSVNNRSAFHPPQQCMIGGGAQMIEKNVETYRPRSAGSDSMKVNEMVIKEHGEKLLVWNWYASQGMVTENFYRQQLSLFINQLRTGRAAGSVVNIFAGIERDDAARARKLVMDFMESFVPFFTEITA